MKKTIRVLGMLALVLAVVLAGNYGLKNFSHEDEKKQKNFIIADEICETDTEYQEFYGLESFTSTFPIILIDTDGELIVKERDTWGRVGIADGADGKNSSDGELAARLNCTVKLRGASSYSEFDKPQYRLTFYKQENGKKLDYALCGMTADSEWVLNGPFLDKTMARNAMMYNIARGTNAWAPDTRFAEVFVNGRYQGLYVVTQPVGEKEGRLGLSDYSLSSGETAYIVKRDRTGTEENVITTWGYKNGRTSNELSISYPTKSKLTTLNKSWIEENVSAFEEALYSDFFADETIGYARYIDVDSFADYFILNEFALNHDAGLLSTYAYRELGGKIKMALWDYNNAFDNYQWFIMEPDEFHLTENIPWFDRLLEDRGFVNRVCARYRELREGALSTEALMKYIDDTEANIADAAARNDKIWGYSFNMTLLTNVTGVERNAFTRAAAVEQLKNIIGVRLDFLDMHMEDLYAKCVN